MQARYGSCDNGPGLIRELTVSGVCVMLARVLIVDDYPIVRRLLRMILETQGDWEVVGEAENGQDAIRMKSELRPDVIVMDITMPVMNGLDATRQIMRSDPQSNVLILTMHDADAVLGEIKCCGAKGVLNKGQVVDGLTSALKTILSGETYFH